MATEKPSWYRLRGYRHLDRPISISAAITLVTFPDNVMQHAFWPFLGYIKSTPRYKQEKHKVVAKKRPIAYASHVDSLVYSYYCEQLAALYEAQLTSRGIQNVVLAYRRFPGGKSNIHFANEAFDEIEKSAPCEAIALDIESFFDNLVHLKLKSQWAKLIGQERLPIDHYVVYKAVTAYTKIDRNRLGKVLDIDPSEGQPTEPLCTPEQFRDAIRRDRGLIEKNTAGIGIPQGSPMSGLLANLYLLDVDAECAAFMQRHGGSYRRYSDDILLICPPNAGAARKSVIGDR